VPALRLGFNLATNLCHLDRHAEAALLLPEVRQMAEALRKGLDQLRVDWLEGRIAAGLGRPAAALAAFARVRGKRNRGMEDSFPQEAADPPRPRSGLRGRPPWDSVPQRTWKNHQKCMPYVHEGMASSWPAAYDAALVTLVERQRNLARLQPYLRKSSDLGACPMEKKAPLVAAVTGIAALAVLVLTTGSQPGRAAAIPLAAPRAGLSSGAGAAATAAAAASPAERLKPCRVEGVREEARCGTYAVWEDREERRGRKIDLYVVVLPALEPAARPVADAVTFLHGGPGAAATEEAGGLSTLRELRRHRDLLLVDQRGTGRSNPLNCDFYGPGSHAKGADPRLLAGELFPPAAVHQCRVQLEKAANLALYTTAIAMDDLDEVRAWLGYDQLDLYGGSYGTRAAQVYLRRHPRAVRAMVLDGVAPVDETLPLHHAYAGKRAVDLLFAECAADAACHAAFPNLAAELQEVFARVDRGVKVRIPDPRAGGTVEVTPDRGTLAEGLRFMMYGASDRLVPLAVHRAFQGDLAQLVTLAADRRANLDRVLSMGMNFSVTCAEDLPFIDDATAARETAGTLLGDYRIREQKRVCADWPRGSIPADAHQLVQSDVPALLISGERDPVTPPEFGRRVASHLPNGLLLIVPHGAHGAEGPCAEGIVARFVERATVKGLDTACIAANPAPHFQTRARVEIQVDPKLLERYAGTYQLEGFDLTLVPRDGHLVAAAAGQADLEMFADAPNHFFSRSVDLEIEVVQGPDPGAPPELVVHLGGQELRGKRRS
jgi:pimeloyl-ACP methyl ester carboxylesterase